MQIKEKSTSELTVRHSLRQAAKLCVVSEAELHCVSIMWGCYPTNAGMSEVYL